MSVNSTSNRKPMRIVIVGAGAVGLFYGSRLHQPDRGILVSLVCRSNYQAIKENGVKLLTHSFGEYTFCPEHVFKSVDDATSSTHSSSGGSSSSHGGRIEWDYVVVTTKATSPASLIRPLLSKHTTVVLIQNGIKIEQDYHSLYPENTLLSAVTIVSAEQIEQGVVRQNRWTRVSIGPFTGATGKPEGGQDKVKEFVEILKAGGVKDAEEYDERGLQFVRWHKIAINASFNPSSVLSNGASNSAMAADPLLRTHVVGVMNEILHLATVVLQSPLPPKFASPEKIIESTLRNTKENFDKSSKNKDAPKEDNKDEDEGESSRPSMWYDWAGGRPMELEAILGNVVKEAERVGVDVPRVHSMYALLCMAQKRRDEANKRAKAKL